MAAFDIVLAALALVSAGACAWAWRNMALTRRLADVETSGISEWPRVSVIMAARNEARRVGPAIASRLADEYDDVEYILVDDRSDDGTAEVALAAAAGDPRLRVVRVDGLPHGWLGKVHALDAGARAATGDYLAFSDADVSVSPGMLRRAVAAAESDGIDSLALVPEYQSRSLLVDATWVVFIRLLSLAVPAGAIRNPKSKAVLGSGAFTLVRRDAFERTAGFEYLRMESGDDMALAAMVKKAGGHCEAYSGASFARVTMYDNVVGFLRGIEKNGSTTAEHPWRATAAVSVSVLLDYAPIAALAVGAIAGPPWLFAVGAATCAFVWAAHVALMWGTCRLWAQALLWPLGSLLFALGLLRSTWLAVRRGGVYWRGTFYPLEELEAGRRFRL